MNKNNNVRLNISQQRGFTFWSFLFVAGVVIFAIYVGAKLVPVYSADSAVKSALNASLEKVSRQDIRKKKLMKEIDKRLYIDGVYEGPDLQEAIVIEKDRNGTTVTLAYRKDIALFYNIGMHLDFSHKVEK